MHREGNTQLQASLGTHVALECIYILKCLWSLCHHCTAKKHEYDAWAEPFLFNEILQCLFCTHQNLFPLIPMFSPVTF